MGKIEIRECAQERFRSYEIYDVVLFECSGNTGILEKEELIKELKDHKEMIGPGFETLMKIAQLGGVKGISSFGTMDYNYQTLMIEKEENAKWNEIDPKVLEILQSTIEQLKKE